MQWGNNKTEFKQQMYNPLTFSPPSPSDIAQNDGGERREFIERLDINYTINRYIKILTWGFGLQTNWVRFSKFYSGTQEEQDYRIGKYGVGTNINFDVPLYGEIKFKGILGYELYSDDTVYRSFDTQYRERLDITGKRYTQFLTHALFFEGELTLHKLFCPTVGVRADMFSGEYNNKLFFLNTTTLPEKDQTIRPKDYSHVSPKVGFYSNIVDDFLRFRANVSNGYMLPPDTTVFNTYMHLAPTELWQYEAGLTVMYKKYLWFDVAGYMIDSDNDVKEFPVGSGLYKNSGTTRRWGIENMVKINPVKYIELDGTFTWMNSEVRKTTWFGTNPATSYIDVGSILTRGASVANIPEFQAGARINWSSPVGLGGGFGWTYVGPQYTDSYGTSSWSRMLILNYLNNAYSLGLNDADTKYKGYNLFDVCLTYTVIINNFPMVFRLDVKNIFNQRWAGYAGNYGIWAAGMPRSFYGSVAVKW